MPPRMTPEKLKAQIEKKRQAAQKAEASIKALQAKHASLIGDAELAEYRYRQKYGDEGEQGSEAVQPESSDTVPHAEPVQEQVPQVVEPQPVVQQPPMESNTQSAEAPPAKRQKVEPSPPKQRKDPFAIQPKPLRRTRPQKTFVNEPIETDPPLSAQEQQRHEMESAILQSDNPFSNIFQF